MKTKLLFILALLPVFLYTQEIVDLNNRALDDLYTDPSSAIYYCDKSISLNKEYKSKEEYIRSLYYKALSYKYLKHYGRNRVNISKAHQLNSSWGFVYNDPDFYEEVIYYFLNKKKSEECYKILSNSVIIDDLSQEGLLKFKLLKLIVDLESGESNSEDFSQLVNASKSFEYDEILSRAYLEFGKSLIESDSNTAITLFNKTIETGVLEYSVEAYHQIGKIYIKQNKLNQSASVLMRGFLLAQDSGDNRVVWPIGNELIKVYQKLYDYRNLAKISQQVIELSDLDNWFTLKETQELESIRFIEDQLEDRNQELSFLTRVLIYGFIGLVIALICLVVILSIQTYRLRHLKLSSN